MKQPNPTIESFALEVVTQEAGQHGHLGATAEAGERALVKMRLHLAELLGAVGVTALLRRAVILARSDYPELGDIAAMGVGLFQGREADVEDSTRNTTASAESIFAVLSHFLALLETFIGQNLTLRLLTGIWPTITIQESLVEADRDIDAREEMIPIQ